jgi:hypothetical protein
MARASWGGFTRTVPSLPLIASLEAKKNAEKHSAGGGGGGGGGVAGRAVRAAGGGGGLGPS